MKRMPLAIALVRKRLKPITNGRGHIIGHGAQLAAARLSAHIAAHPARSAQLSRQVTRARARRLLKAQHVEANAFRTGKRKRPTL